MLTALKEFLRAILAPFAAPGIYIAAVWTTLHTIFKRAEWGLFVLVAMIPLPNIWYKFHGYPLGKDLIDILVFSIIAGIIINKDGFSKSRNGTFLAFFIILNYAALWNTSLHFSLQDLLNTKSELLMDWKNYAEMIFLYFLALNAVRDEKSLQTLVVIMATVVLLISVRESRGFTEGVSFSYDKRLEGPFWIVGLGANHLSAFIAEYGGLLLGLYLLDDNKKRRWLYLTACLFGLYPLLFSYSRGGYLAALAVFAFYGLVEKRRLLIVLAVVVVGWQTLLPKTVIERIEMTETNSGQIESSAAARLELWNHAEEVFYANPVFGVGFGGFAYTLPQGSHLTDTHNFYMRTLSEQGIIGIMAYLLLLGKAFSSGLSLYRLASPPFMKGLGLGFMGCIVASVVLNLFGDRWSYFVLGGYLFVAWGLVDRALLLIRQSDEGHPQATASAGGSYENN